MDEFDALSEPMMPPSDAQPEDPAIALARQEHRDRGVFSLSPDELAVRHGEVESEDLWGYEPINVRAQYVRATQGRGASGGSVVDYLAQSQENDPYYVGKPGEWVYARWLERVFPQLGYTKPVHIRAVHYAIRRVTTYTFPVMNNTAHVIKELSYNAHLDQAWEFLQQAVAAARYLKVLPWEAIADHRNPPPKGYVRVDEPTADVSVLEVGVVPGEEIAAQGPIAVLPYVPAMPSLPFEASLPLESRHLRASANLPAAPTLHGQWLPRYALDAYQGAQRYAVEVWCEKSTMDDVLLPWCEAHNAQLVTSEGEMTITQAHRAVQRIIRRGKPTVILYVSDFDFKGQQMPVSMARKVQWFRDDARRNGTEPPEIVLVTAALTGEQVKRFRLLDEPIPEKHKFMAAGKRKGQERT